MAKELIEFDVFDAGLNTKADPINLLNGQSYSMDNILFGDYGSIRTRGGISTHNSDAFSTDGPAGFASYQPSTMSAQMMVVANGQVFVMTGVSTVPVSISGSTGIWNPYYAVEMEQMNEKMFIAAADHDPRKFNGSELTLAGVRAPTQVLTAACDAAGDLTGEYQYVYWGVNEYGAEGDYITTPSAVKTIASGNIRVNNIPTAPASHGISYWKVGRNTAGAAGIYWHVTDVTNGVTGFTDVAADDTLDVLAPTDQGYPRQFQNMCVYGGRLWGSVGDVLWYSNVNQPEEFPSTNFIRVGNGTGVFISAIAPFMGMIVISMSGWDPKRSPTFSPFYSEKTQLYVLRIGDSISFNDPENWYLSLIVEGAGSESQRACIPVAGYLWLTSRSGVSLFDGSGISLNFQETSVGGVGTSKISDPIGSLFEFDNKSDIRVAAAIQWNDRVYLSIANERLFSNTKPGNNMTIVYDTMRVGKADPTRGAWSSFSVSSVSKFVVHEGQLFGAGPQGILAVLPNNRFSGGYVFKWDNGNDYDRSDADPLRILPNYYMAPIRGKKNHIYNEKEFRFLRIWCSGTGTLVIQMYVNGNVWGTGTAIAQQAITLSATGSENKITLPAGASGKHLWIAFQMIPASGSEVTDFSISRVQVFYNLRGLRNN